MLPAQTYSPGYNALVPKQGPSYLVRPQRTPISPSAVLSLPLPVGDGMVFSEKCEVRD